MPRRAFTIAEANALLPVLESVLRRIEQRRADVLRHNDQLQVLDLLWGARLLQPDNPDHAEAMSHRATILAHVREIERLTEKEILGRGIRFPQGGLEHGLLDFPTTWKGRWVYLCWRRGEPSVASWHETDAGFAGRQPLTREHELRMGLEDDPERLDDSRLDF